MAGHETAQVRPKTAQNTLKIAAGSPLAIQGIFLEVIRERFAADAGIDWTWRDEPTTTDILVEASYNEETEARSQIPAVYVTRIQSTPQKVVVGDRVGVRLPDHCEGFGALMSVAMQLECVSNDEGESSLVGDIVQMMVMASQDVIQREFGFLNITHPILGQTTPFERDQRKWTSPVSFSVDFWVRWSTVPIAPLLQQFAQRLSANGNPSVFKDTVLNSMRRADTSFDE